MKDKNQIMSEAQNIIDARRNLAVNKSRDARDKMMDKVPEFAEVTNELSACGAELGRLAISGNLRTPKYDDILKKMADLEKKRNDILKKEGESGNLLGPDFTCKICGDTGFVKDSDGNETMCECLRLELGKIYLENSNLPMKEGFEAHRPEIFCEEDREKVKKRIESAKTAVLNYPSRSKRLILGKSGVGKTFFASMFGTELARSGRQVVYITIPELMKGLLYFGEDEYLAEQRDRLSKLVKNTDVLILDELGTEKMSEAKQDILAAIVDERYRDETKGLIVVTNSTLREILDNYGERIFSRLTSKDVIIDSFELADGKDLRKK